MKRMWLIGLALAISMGLTACASTGQSVSPGYDTGYYENSDGAVAPDDKSESGGDGGTSSSEDRSVIKTASAYLTAVNPADAASDLVDFVTSKQGRVDQRNIYTDSDGNPVQAMLVLRIPSNQLTAVLDELPEFGAVQSLEEGASDVTVTVRDLEARVAALDTSVKRLLDLLAKSTTTSELIEIESALTQRQAELDGLKTTLAYYQDAVSYSTLSVTIVTEADALPNTPDNFWEGVVAGWNALVAFGEGVLISSGVALPWLIVIGAPVVAVVVLVLRRVRRGRSSKTTGGPKGN